MPLQFVKGPKKDQLVKDGNIFMFEKDGVGGKRIWRCIKGDKEKCRGRIHTLGQSVIWENEVHNHDPNCVEVSVKKVIEEIKVKAATQQETPQVTVAAATVDISEAVRGALPRTDALKKTVKRARRAAENPLANPRSLSDFDVPEMYKFTIGLDPELFLLYDSGRIPERILIFSTVRNLDLLQSSRHWFADGTFKTAPPLFAQVWTIHAIKFNTVIPLVYALLPNKTRATYVKTLEALNNLVPTLAPTTIMTDFEKAEYSAFTEVFDDVQLRGCYFHFGQCLWRQIQCHNNIQRRYKDPEEPDFALNIRKLMALSFVPPPDVEASFVELMQSPFYTQNEDVIQPLTDYFEDTWIGRPRAVGRRPPLFDIQLWNQYHGTLEDLPKTNNSIEGWHRGFASFVSCYHPNLWKFIQKLREHQSFNDLKITQLIAGQQPPPTRDHKATERIKNIVADYGNRSIHQYLQGLAHNVRMQVDV